MKELWNTVKDKKDQEDIRVFVKDIAIKIADTVSDPDYENYKKTLHKICAFVGGKLKGYVIFKGGMTNGVTRYDINKIGVKQILESKGLFEIVEAVDLVEGVEDKKPNGENSKPENSSQSSLDSEFGEVSEEKTDSEEEDK